MLEFNPPTMLPMVTLPLDYKGGLLFLVPIPPGVGGFSGGFYVYRPDQVLVLGPATILEGFGRQP